MPTPDQLADTLLAQLPSEREQKNRKALALLLPAIAGGEIYNTEFQDAKGALDRSFEQAFNAIVRTDYTTYWEADKKTVTPRGLLSNELGHAMGLRGSIAAAKKVAKTKTDAPNLGELRALLTAAVPFAELMEKLKTRAIKGRRPATGGTSKEKRIAGRVGGSGECQICSGSHALVKGKISLHGYKRPGIGFIEGRCMGANELPYEVSCEVLRKYISTLKRHLTIALDRLTEIPFAKEFTVIRPVRENGHRVMKAITVLHGEPNFERVREEEKRTTEYRIKDLNTEIAWQEKRLVAWAPAA